MLDATSFMPQIDFIRRPRDHGEDSFGRPMPRYRCKPKMPTNANTPKPFLAKSEKRQPDKRQAHR